MKRRKSISPLLLFLYSITIIALLVYLYEPNSSDTKEPTTMPPSKKTEQMNRQNHQSATINPKIEEKELHEVDFNTRLKKIKAKVGDRIFIRIFKKESLLEVWIKPQQEYILFKRYPICKYSGYLGPKLKEGDRQSPEGFYKVTKDLLNPNSKYHLAFNLGYPNAYDKAHKRTGSFLMVHGECVSIGCYAMTNTKIEEIYTLVEGALHKGQRYVQVHAFPFFMTDENMAIYQESQWYDFWSQLKEGYDYFEAEKLPPRISVKNRRYTIHEANE